MRPDFRIDARDLTVHGPGEEFRIALCRRPIGSGDVVLGLLDLDHATACGGDLAQLGVEDVGPVGPSLTKPRRLSTVRARSRHGGRQT